LGQRGAMRDSARVMREWLMKAVSTNH
jgi:hypothetical protein